MRMDDSNTKDIVTVQSWINSVLISCDKLDNCSKLTKKTLLEKTIRTISLVRNGEIRPI